MAKAKRKGEMPPSGSDKPEVKDPSGAENRNEEQRQYDATGKKADKVREAEEQVPETIKEEKSKLDKLYAALYVDKYMPKTDEAVSKAAVTGVALTAITGRSLFKILFSPAKWLWKANSWLLGMLEKEDKGGSVEQFKKEYEARTKKDKKEEVKK